MESGRTTFLFGSLNLIRDAITSLDLIFSFTNGLVKCGSHNTVIEFYKFLKNAKFPIPPVLLHDVIVSFGHLGGLRTCAYVFFIPCFCSSCLQALLAKLSNFSGHFPPSPNLQLLLCCGLIIVATVTRKQ
jgi:hypothetical protein